MSDWVVKDWRVAPRGRYAIAILGAALFVSSMILGASMAAIPDEGAFDDDHIRQVADNRLLAVEALWVGDLTVNMFGYEGDGITIRLSSLNIRFDSTLRWTVQSVFILEAENRHREEQQIDSHYRYVRLLDTIDEKFGWVTTEGTYSAWELRFNGSLVHFGSDAVEEPGHIPDSHWTVTHDYSEEVQRWFDGGVTQLEAQIVYHLWFETEDPVF